MGLLQKVRYMNFDSESNEYIFKNKKTQYFKYYDINHTSYISLSAPLLVL
jgi:Ca2+-binding EF-hand superfamily protein